MITDKIIKIQYLLSEEGQKKSLLSGGTGRMLQEIEVPLTEGLLSQASVDEKGNAIIKIGIDQEVDYLFGKKEIQLNKDAAEGFIPKSVKCINTVTTKKFDEPQTFDQLLIYKSKLNDYLKEKMDLMQQELFEEKKLKRKMKFKLGIMTICVGAPVFLTGGLIIHNVIFLIGGFVLLVFAASIIVDIPLDGK
jgi:hypothetical protein